MDRLTSFFTNLFQSKIFNLPSRSYLLLVLLFALIIQTCGITREIPFIFTADVVGVYFGPKHMISRVFRDQTPNIWNFVIPPAKYWPAFKYILFVGFSLATLSVSVYLQIAQGLSFSLAAEKAARWLISSGGLIITGRLVSSIFGLLTIYLVYRLGKELFSREAGVIAALFLAVMPQHVSFAQYIRVDSSLLFWTVLLAWFSCKIVVSGDMKYYLATGIVFGVLFSTKQTAPFFGLFILHAHFLRIRQEKTGWTKMFWDKRVLYTTLMILLGILIAFPAIYLQPGEYINWFNKARINSTHTIDPVLKGFAGYSWGFIPGLILSWGRLLTFIAFAGIIPILFHKSKSAQITVVTPLLFFIFMSIQASGRYTPRWIGPVYPFFALWASFLCYWVMGKLGPSFKDERIKKAVVTLGLTVLIVKPLYMSIKSTYTLNRPDTRIVSHKWVQKNIPKNSVIATYTSHFWAQPPLGGYQLVSIYFKQYNVKNALEKDRALTINSYREQGVQYFILDGWHKYFHYREIVEKMFPETAKSFQAFYREIETNSELVFMLDPKSGNYNGPRIEIYRLLNNQ